MEIKVVIEIPLGSNIKYELDEEEKRIKVDRILYTAMFYPANYGFALNTLSEDKDPLDVLVLSNYPFLPGSFVKAKPIGILWMEDEEGVDYKIIAVPVKKVDPVYGKYEDIKDVPKAILDKIKHFFEHYKELEPGKWVKVKDFSGREEAEKKVQEAIERANQ